LAFHSGREADHSPPSSAKVKEWVELYLHSHNTPSWRGVQLGGAQDIMVMVFEKHSILLFSVSLSLLICIHFRGVAFYIVNLRFNTSTLRNKQTN
jgi:hypothetical protein